MSTTIRKTAPSFVFPKCTWAWTSPLGIGHVSAGWVAREDFWRGAQMPAWKADFSLIWQILCFFFNQYCKSNKNANFCIKQKLPPKWAIIIDDYLCSSISLTMGASSNPRRACIQQKGGGKVSLPLVWVEMAIFVLRHWCFQSWGSQTQSRTDSTTLPNPHSHPQAFRLGLNDTAGFPGSPAWRWHIVELVGLHKQHVPIPIVKVNILFALFFWRTLTNTLSDKAETLVSDEILLKTFWPWRHTNKCV